MLGNGLPSNRGLAVFTARLLGVLVAGFLFLKAPFVGPALDAFCLFLAKLKAGILGLFDSQVHREGITYYRHNWGNAVAVTRECGAFELSLVSGAVISLLKRPVPWRLKAIAYSLLIIQGINVMRLVILLYGRVLLSPQAFVTFHYQLLPFLFGLFIIGLLSFVLREAGPFSASRKIDAKT